MDAGRRFVVFLAVLIAVAVAAGTGVRGPRQRHLQRAAPRGQRGEDQAA